jgi:Protein of unknown function (DUF3626)
MTNTQLRAMQNVRAKARDDQDAATQRITAIFKKHRLDTDIAVITNKIHDTGVVTINFHPDRLCNDGRSVAAALYEEGIFRTQFETGISNGGLNRIVGGKRDLWETQLWGRSIWLRGYRSLSGPSMAA